MTTSAGSARILVVDDEPLVCDSVRRMLVSCGYQVEAATSAREGLERFEKSPFDLVIIDYLMPEMKGDVLTAEIKARAANQPVVLITAAVEMLEAAHPLPGVEAVVGKPFQAAELQQVVDAVLSKSHPHG